MSPADYKAERQRHNTTMKTPTGICPGLVQALQSSQQWEGQPQVGSDAGLGVGALLMLSFGAGAEEATIEAKYEQRYLVRWKRFGREIMNLEQLKARKFIVLPPQPPRRSWWSQLFTPNPAAHQPSPSEG